MLLYTLVKTGTKLDFDKDLAGNSKPIAQLSHSKHNILQPFKDALEGKD